MKGGGRYCLKIHFKCITCLKDKELASKIYIFNCRLRKTYLLKRKVMEDSEYDSVGWNSLISLGQDLVNRQGVEIGNPLAIALAGGLAILVFQLLLPLLAPLLSSGLSSSSLERQPVPLLPPLSLSGLPAVAVTREERPRLQNHPKCGITTGGQVRLSHICAVCT